MSRRRSNLTDQRAALIAAILDAPDDDTPRLICAEWDGQSGREVTASKETPPLDTALEPGFPGR